MALAMALAGTFTQEAPEHAARASAGRATAGVLGLSALGAACLQSGARWARGELGMALTVDGVVPLGIVTPIALGCATRLALVIGLGVVVYGVVLVAAGLRRHHLEYPRPRATRLTVPVVSEIRGRVGPRSRGAGRAVSRRGSRTHRPGLSPVLRA